MGTTEVAEDAPPPPPALAELSLTEAGKARSMSRPPIGASPIGASAIGRSADYSSASGGADTPPLAPSLASPLAGCPVLILLPTQPCPALPYSVPVPLSCKSTIAAVMSAGFGEAVTASESL